MTVSVAWKLEPSGSQTSTISSRRVESGKNCLGMYLKLATLTTNSTTVSPITSQRCCTQASMSARRRR